MKTTIDINADLGEGIGYDSEIMPHISSCNIACGGHYGTEQSIIQTIRLARLYKVNIGAHPSFPDKDNFGRKVLTLTKSELSQSIYNQLMSFASLCQSENTKVHHIKLHGALYNYAAKDAPTSDAVMEAIIATGLRPKLYLPYDSVLHHKALDLLPLEFEAFIDRKYNDDCSLVSREHPDAIIDSPEKAWQQLFNLIRNQQIESNSGKKISIKATTYCVHGDNVNAVAIVRFISQQLELHKIKLR